MDETRGVVIAHHTCTCVALEYAGICIRQSILKSISPEAMWESRYVSFTFRIILSSGLPGRIEPNDFKLCYNDCAVVYQHDWNKHPVLFMKYAYNENVYILGDNEYSYIGFAYINENNLYISYFILHCISIAPLRPWGKRCQPDGHWPKSSNHSSVWSFAKVCLYQ